jgi:RNA polymerase sigma-70 factor (ECF subfamily)
MQGHTIRVVENEFWKNRFQSSFFASVFDDWAVMRQDEQENGGDSREEPSSYSGEDLSTLRREDQLRLLEKFENYLLRIANDELDTDLNGPAGASDLVQQTLLKAVENIGAYRGTTQNELQGWLRIILINLIKDWRKKLNREKRTGGQDGRHLEKVIDANPTPGSHLKRIDELECLNRALERLPPHYREVLMLWQRDRLSWAEIGQRLNKTDEAARQTYARALRRLQQEMGQ